MSALLSQAEADLYSKPGRRAGIGICYQGFVEGAFKISLHRELLIDHIADVRPELEINVAVGYGIDIINLALYGLVVTDGKVHPESDIIL